MKCGNNNNSNINDTQTKWWFGKPQLTYYFNFHYLWKEDSLVERRGKHLFKSEAMAYSNFACIVVTFSLYSASRTMVAVDAVVHSGSSCRLCRKGNTSNPDADLPFLSPDNNDGNAPTCGEYEKSMSMLNENISCDLSAQFLGNYCQCDGRSMPVKQPKCSLCGASDIAEHNIFANQLYHFQSNKAINITRFPFSTCQKLAQATEMLLTESSEDCQVLRLRFADYCGCENTKIDDSCSLCTDRSPVTKPSRQVKFLRDQYFGLDPTCEIFESSVRSFESNSKECQEAQKLGSYCGCPARENACRFCEVGEITKPDKELKILENQFGYAPTCVQVEAILQQSSPNSQVCQISQEMDYLCGCRDGLYGYHGTENEREQRILALLPRVGGSISVFGSLFIMVDSVYIKRSPGTYHVLMFFMAFFDLITSVCWIIGSKAVPRKLLLWFFPLRHNTSCDSSMV